MPEWEKVMRGLEACQVEEDGCTTLCKANSCPYNVSSTHCMTNLHKDTLALLKEQEAKVLDWNEISTVDGTIWLEDRDKSEVVSGLVMQMHSAVNFDIKKDGKLRTGSASRSDYGDRWRAWSARPTEKQIRDTKWEGDSDAE